MTDSKEGAGEGDRIRESLGWDSCRYTLWILLWHVWRSWQSWFQLSAAANWKEERPREEYALGAFNRMTGAERVLCVCVCVWVGGGGGAQMQKLG